MRDTLDSTLGEKLRKGKRVMQHLLQPPLHAGQAIRPELFRNARIPGQRHGMPAIATVADVKRTVAPACCRIGREIQRYQRTFLRRAHARAQALVGAAGEQRVGVKEIRVDESGAQRIAYHAAAGESELARW